ncbi:retrovirus-related pol polyprotein from transposon TNT 1-94 [Tanacetum coccineum]
MVVIEDCWFQAKQDKIHEFDRLEVWELVPRPIYVMVIALKWIYKVKLDEHGDVLKNKARLVAKGYRQEEDIDFEIFLSHLELLKGLQLLQIATRFNNTMAEQNVPAQPPTRTDEQIVPRSQCNTNFFQAFTASANVPAIYLQQFWKTMSYNEKTRVYSCQVDEQWFDLSVDLLRKALAITPIIPAHPFELPPSGDTVIDFVNKLGYPEPVEIERLLAVTNPDTPRYANAVGNRTLNLMLDHAERLWEEFTQGIRNFFSTKPSLKNPMKKVSPLLIPYGRFSKVIIYYLASNNNIHRRPDSAVHHTGDDYILGNLKFVPKGESVEYLKMVAENTKKTPQESASVQPATKRAAPKKATTTTPIKQSKPAPLPTKKPSKRKLPQKVRKGKPTFQLVDEEDKAQ